MSEFIEKIVLTVWIGSMWTVGIIVAPSLFASLPEQKSLAGDLVSPIFSMVYYLGVFSVTYLITMLVMRSRIKSSLFWLLVVALLAVFIQLSVLQPMMADIRETGINETNASRFGMLHGIAWLLYLLNSLIGLFVLWKWRSN